MRKRPAPVSSISKTRRVCLHNRNNAGRFVFVSWQTRRAVSAALLHSLALCPNTSKTRPKTRQKRPKTGANVVLFRRNLLNFCILLIRPKHGQTKTRGGAAVSGFRAGGEHCTRGGQNTRPTPTIRRAALRLCPSFSCPRFALFVPMIRPSCPRFGVFVPMKGGRGVFTIRRGEYRYKPAAPAFGRGRGLSTFSISGGRLLLSLYHLRGAGGCNRRPRAACFCTRQSLNKTAAPCALPPYCFSLPLPLRD